MTSTINKFDNNQETKKFMENLSTDFFSKLFVNSTICIEEKSQSGKQGGHVVVIKNDETSSSSASSLNIHRKFYVKPQDQFLLTPTSSLMGRLTDIEEIFIYKFLHNIKKLPLVYFYVHQQKPDCLLIATADANTISDEKFYTAASYPAADLKLISMENIIQIRIFEIIFFLKDLLSNENNYGWLRPSKTTVIIDFSIEKNEMMKANPKAPLNMLTDKIESRGRLVIDKHKANFNKLTREEKESMARRAIESLVGCFVEAIDPTQQSINDFICAHPYAFDGGIEMATLKLQKIVQQTRSRWNELVAQLGLKQ